MSSVNAISHYKKYYSLIAAIKKLIMQAKPWWFQTFQLLFTIWQSKYNFCWYFACRVLHKMLQSFHLFFKLFTPLLFVKLLLAYLIHFRFRRDSVFISPSKLTTTNLTTYIFYFCQKKKENLYIYCLCSTFLYPNILLCFKKHFPRKNCNSSIIL